MMTVQKPTQFGSVDSIGRDACATMGTTYRRDARHGGSFIGATSNFTQRTSSQRRGFTLVELMLAILISTMVFGAIWTSLGQLSKARSLSRTRMAAYVRADAAMNAVRRDLFSVLRSDDLFLTKLRINDGLARSVAGNVDRDDLLLFSSRMRLSRPAGTLNQGEGMEYEVQYRIVDDEAGSVLWQRRDAVADEYFDGGGVATPLVTDIASLNVEAFDGEEWFSNWDSDDDGLPFAIRLTIVAAIDDSLQNPVILRTVVPIDRVLPPYDAGLTEEELEALNNPENDPTGESGEGGEGNNGDNQPIPNVNIGGGGRRGGGGRSGGGDGGRGGGGGNFDVPRGGGGGGR